MGRLSDMPKITLLINVGAGLAPDCLVLKLYTT